MACSNCTKISNTQRCTLNAYTSAQTALIAGQTLSFDEYEISGTSVSLSSNGNKIFLKEGGLYYITFNAFGKLTTPGAITTVDEAFYVQMFANGNAVEGAEAAADAQSFENISFSKIVKVNPSCPYVDNSVEITFENAGAPTTVENMNVVVIRLA